MFTLNRLTETRWKITANAVKIYPHRIFKIYAVTIPVILPAIFWLVVDYRQFSFNTNVVILGATFSTIFLCWAYSGTYLKFDNRKYVLQKIIFGLFPILTIPYDELEEISEVDHYGTKITYRLIKNDEPQGAGILVSSCYSNSQDPNAIAFKMEAVSLINGFLDLYNVERTYVLPTIDISSYKYFKKRGSLYEVKDNSRGVICVTVFLVVITGWIAVSDILRPHMNLLLAPTILYLTYVYFITSYTKVRIDKNAMTITKTGQHKATFVIPTNINAFKISRSATFTFMPADIDLLFIDPTTNKSVKLTLTTMNKSKNIARLNAEVLDILYRPGPGLNDLQNIST